VWLKKFKIALVEQNAENIVMLLDDIPEFSSLAELEEAKNLVDSANELFRVLQEETQLSMIQMKKNIDFLNATQSPHTSKLDIKS